MQLTLGQSQVGDEAFVNELTRKTMQSYVEATWSDEESREHYYHVNRFNVSNTRIVYDGEQAIGRISLEHRPGEIFIDNMHVLPQMQGRGVGGWILEKVIAEAIAQRCRLLVTVLKANPAKRLYERCGFETYGEANHRYEMRFNR